jgi:hypothetical protein
VAAIARYTAWDYLAIVVAVDAVDELAAMVAR